MFSFFRKKPPVAPDGPTPEPFGTAAVVPPTPAAPSPLVFVQPSQVPSLVSAPTRTPAVPVLVGVSLPAPEPELEPAPLAEPARKGWLDKLKTGLRKTGTSIAAVFTGTRIDEALYEELETALLMADTGVKATEHLLADLKQRVKESKTTDPAAVKSLLADAITALLEPLQSGC